MSFDEIAEIGRISHPSERHHFSFDGTFFVCVTNFSCTALLTLREAAEYINHLLDKLTELALRSPVDAFDRRT